MEAVTKALATVDRPRPPVIGNRYNTLLIRAAMEQDLVECENLIANFGADVNETGINGMNCLHVACEKGDIDMIKFFLERGVNINGQEDKAAGGNTPLLITLKLAFDEVCHNFTPSLVIRHLPFSCSRLQSFF
jgi:ankyrin repeat protein